MSNVLNESAENYLETILILSQKLPVVRSVDIANELGFKKSSELRFDTRQLTPACVRI